MEGPAWRQWHLTCCLWLVLAGQLCIGVSSSAPPGHLKPLGSHRPTEGNIDVVDGFIEPEQFFKNYVRENKPLLFRGAARNLPAFKKWNDAYMKENYGSLFATVEEGKKEDRDRAGLDSTIGQFLDMYNKSKVYMVQDVHKEMMEDVCLPKPLFCGGFQHVVMMNVMWFSSGGTRSVLHNDDIDNINCLIDGEKDFIMFDKKFKPKIEANDFNFERGFSYLDVDKVDMVKYPNMANLPWWKGHMDKGDCLFIPLRWYHQVNSSKGRNLAINLWFQHLFWFDEKDCKTEQAKRDLKKNFIPLSRYKFTGADGKDTVRYNIFHVFEGQMTITAGDVMEKYPDALTAKEVEQFIEMLDKNGDSILTWDEVHEAEPNSLLDNFPELYQDYSGEEDSPSYRKKAPKEDEEAAETIGDAKKKADTAPKKVEPEDSKVEEGKKTDSDKTKGKEEAKVKSADSKTKTKTPTKKKAAPEKTKTKEAKAKEKASAEKTKSKKAKAKKPAKKGKKVKKTKKKGKKKKKAKKGKKKVKKAKKGKKKKAKKGKKKKGKKKKGKKKKAKGKKKGKKKAKKAKKSGKAKKKKAKKVKKPDDEL